MRKKHLLSIFSISLFLITFMVPIPTWASSSPVSPGTGADMLQFKAGGHVLGFQANKAYFASLDHALSVEFLGTPGVMPKAAAIPHATGSMPKAPLLSKVVYQNLWDGISLTYQSTKDGITESIYYLAPGADVSKIRLRYNVPVESQRDGSLMLRFSSGFLTESAPVAWQEIGGKRIPVTVAFMVSNGEIGFRLGEYDPNQALIIDPTYAWHTFYGSNLGDEEGYSIATDSAGNVYITGYSSENWNGPAAQPPLHAHSGSDDIFVLKLNSSGAYQWHTFYGGSDSDLGMCIAVDSDRNVYVTGYSGDWTGLSPIDAFGSGPDIFVLKLDTNGAYQWHTFRGGSAGQIGYGIATDISGNVYVTGTSDVMLIVFKLNSSGVREWSNLYGDGASEQQAFSVATYGGNVYVTGRSISSWNGFPGNTPPIHAFTAGPDPENPTFDIFILKLNSSGTYQWHTFYGGADDDSGNGVGIDSSENIYVTGYSHASWNGPAPENTSPLNAYSGISDIFVLKLNSSGAYQWHTFYGTNGGPEGISVDAAGNVYVSGATLAHWTGPAGQSPLYTNDSGMIFALKLAANGAYQWHAFFGTANDWGNGISVNNGNVYIAASGGATWNGPGGQPPLHAYSGNSDILVLKMAVSGLIDFNGDDKPDILWRNPSSGENYVWYMNSGNFLGSVQLFTIPAPWEIVGVADFDGDTHPDILWRNPSSGENYIWYMNGGTFLSSVQLFTIPAPWEIVGIADFNGDTHPDILWRNPSSGENYIWHMNGGTFLSSAQLFTIPAPWEIAGVADFNGDNKIDILWRNPTSGENYIWYMNGGTFLNSVQLFTIPAPWEIVGVADFNGDSNPDILWRNPTSGENYIWYMNGGTFLSSVQLFTIPAPWEIVGQ